MARDRGQVNRTLLGVKLPDGPVPHNSLLYNADKEVGRVTSSVVSPRLGPIGLAYIRHPDGRVLTPDVVRAGEYQVNVGGQLYPATVGLRPDSTASMNSWVRKG